MPRQYRDLMFDRAAGFGGALAVLLTGTAFAAPPRDDAGEIRETAAEILSAPEFRYFERLDTLGEGEPGPDGSSSGNFLPNAGGNGGRDGANRAGQGGQDGNADGRQRHRQQDQQAQEDRADRSPPESSSSGPSAGGGLAAAVGTLFHLVAWGILATICGAIVYLIYRAVRDYQRPARLEVVDESERGVLEPERSPGETPADVFAARARELAAAGRYRDAVAQLLLGAMSHIERAGLIRFRRGLTHRDYLRVVHDRRPQYEALRSMVSVYEPLGFGRRAATPEHFEQSLARYEAGFRGAN